MVHYARWTIAGVLITSAALLALYQIGGFVRIIYRGWRGDEDDRGYSLIPLFGGLLGMVGCIVAPSSSVRGFWWLPLIVDPGCAFLLGVMFAHSRRCSGTNRAFSSCRLMTLPFRSVAMSLRRCILPVERHSLRSRR